MGWIGIDFVHTICGSVAGGPASRSPTWTVEPHGAVGVVCVVIASLDGCPPSAAGSVLQAHFYYIVFVFNCNPLND